MHISHHVSRIRRLINASLYRFDSSKGRGDFETQIGVGKVIKGILDMPYIQERDLRLTYTKAGMRALHR